MKYNDIRRIIDICGSCGEQCQSAVSPEEVKNLVIAKIKAGEREVLPDNIPYKKKLGWLRWSALAACFGIIAVSALSINFLSKNETVTQIEQIAPAEDSPDGMRKFINYNGNRYVFLENGAAYSLTSEQLGKSLGILEYDIQSDPQTNGKKEFSATYALGGTIYEMKAYNPYFRIAVEFESKYYICQNAANTDGTVMEIPEFFKAAGFPDAIKGISVSDHFGKETLSEIPNKETADFIEELSQVKPAELDGDQYQQIAKAQNEGKSYQLFFNLKDGTKYSLYLIPELNIAMIGDNRYMFSDEFSDKFGHLFEDLY